MYDMTQEQLEEIFAKKYKKVKRIAKTDFEAQDEIKVSKAKFK